MTSQTCTICRRSLTNQDSISKGIGPECEANYKRYLAAAGTDAEEIAKLALSDDPTVTRWVSLIGRAIGSGRQAEVNRFLDAARRAYDLAQREPLEVAA